MTSRNWRTSLGGAIGVFGTTLIGAALLYTIADNTSYKKLLFITAFLGIILSGFGKAITAWNAADAQEVEKLKKQSNDTEHFLKEKLGGEAEK